MPEARTVELELYTVEQFCTKEPAFKPGGVRWQIFNAEENGLAADVKKRWAAKREPIFFRLFKHSCGVTGLVLTARR